MGFRSKLWVVVALLLAASTTAAAADDRVGVYLGFSGNDPLGKQLEFFFREQLRESSTFREVYEETEGALVVYLTTIDPSPKNDGLATAYSYVLALENRNGFNYHVKSSVGVCGGSKVRDCAVRLYGSVGASLEEIRRDILAASAPEA